MLVSVLVIARILILGLCVAGLAGSPIGQTTNSFQQEQPLNEHKRRTSRQSGKNDHVYIYVCDNIIYGIILYKIYL